MVVEARENIMLVGFFSVDCAKYWLTEKEEYSPSHDDGQLSGQSN